MTWLLAVPAAWLASKLVIRRLHRSTAALKAAQGDTRLVVSVSPSVLSELRRDHFLAAPSLVTYRPGGDEVAAVGDRPSTAATEPPKDAA